MSEKDTNSQEVEALFAELERKVLDQGIWDDELKFRIYELSDITDKELYRNPNPPAHMRMAHLGSIWSALRSAKMNPKYRQLADRYAAEYVAVYETAKVFADRFGGKKC